MKPDEIKARFKEIAQNPIYPSPDFRAIEGRLKTKEDFIDYFEKTFNGGGFGWWNYKAGSPMNEVNVVYKLIIEKNNEDPEKYGVFLENYEDACVDILTQNKLFFKDVTGNPLGLDVVCSFLYSDDTGTSTNVENGTFAKKLSQHVKVDDLVAKKIKEGSEEYGHQMAIIRVMHRTRTYEIPGEDFWEKMVNNGIIKIDGKNHYDKKPRGDKE